MAFDVDMIQQVYAGLAARVDAARALVGRPLTLAEKILYAHLFDNAPPGEAFVRGTSYVDFAPDRVAMQDATAQMALLQFMQAGRAQAAVPSTVHCDHLIPAEVGAYLTMVYPDYSLVVPKGTHIRVPVVIGLQHRSERGERFLDTWIELRRQDGTLDELYDHWILGKQVTRKERRWSVIQDVLHWVD